jgi:hypothetical protein
MICSRLITIVVIAFAAVASAASDTKDKPASDTKDKPASDTKDKPLGIEHEGTEMKTTGCEMSSMSISLTFVLSPTSLQSKHGLW